MESKYPYDRSAEFERQHHKEATETEVNHVIETTRRTLIESGHGHPVAIGDEGDYMLVSRRFTKSELENAGWSDWASGYLATYEGINHQTDQSHQTVEMVLENSVFPDNPNLPIVTDVKRIRMNHYSGGSVGAASDYEIQRLQLINGELAEPLPLGGDVSEQAGRIVEGHGLSRQIDLLYSGEVTGILKLIRRI